MGHSSKIIFEIKSKDFDTETESMLSEKLSKISEDTDVAIDMRQVEDIDNTFLHFLKCQVKNRKLHLINLSSEAFTLLNLTFSDKLVKIYLNDFDFISNRRELINRRFTLIK